MRKIVRPLIGLLLLAMPLPMGANRTWMLLVLLAGILVVAGCAAAAAAVGGRLSSRLHVLRGPFWLAAAWLGLLLAQGHLGTGFALEAGGAETRGELVAVLDTYPQWVPLSLYPDATWHDLGYALFGFGLFFLVVFAVRIARHAYLLLGFVLLSAFLQAGFGAWEYLASQDFPTLAALTDKPINGTFLNRNHFAGYLAMAAGVLVGLLIGRVFEEDEAGNGQSSWLVRMLFVLTGRGMLAIGLVAPLLVVIAASGSRGAMAGLLLVIFAFTPVLVVIGFAAAGLGVATGFPLSATAAAGRGDLPPAVNVAALQVIGVGAFLLTPPLVGGIAELAGLRVGIAIVLPMLVASIYLARELNRKAAPEKT